VGKGASSKGARKGWSDSSAVGARKVAEFEEDFWGNGRKIAKKVRCPLTGRLAEHLWGGATYEYIIFHFRCKIFEKFTRKIPLPPINNRCPAINPIN
jgi:hypothetical protein